MKKKIFLILVMALMTVTSAIAQTRELQIYKGGSLIQSFPVSNIDSIKVGYAFNAPGNVSARLSNKSIVVTWSTVSDAQSYQLYRSGDNKNFVLLAGNLTTTTYTDKSPLKGTNYYKVKAIGKGKESALSESTGTATLPGSGMESGLYLGVMGFNQNLNLKPISILNKETKSEYDTFINAMTTKNATVLCYAVDQSINTLQSTPLPDDIFKVAIVTFTDGIDRGSLMWDKRFSTEEDFLTAIHKRITEETVVGKEISAYSIGLRGNDITTPSDIATFQSTLKQLASTDANAKEVTSMAEVNAKFQEIAEQLSTSNTFQTLMLRIPGTSDARIRFTFDNVSSAAQSNVYIEGTFNRSTCSLTDVEYHGMSHTSGTTIQGVVEEVVYVKFQFDGLQTDNGKLINKDEIKKWVLTGSNSWQHDTEFNSDDGDIEVVVTKKSAVIMLVLDCSTSLGSQFSTLQSNAKSFVNTLCQSTEGDGGNSNPDVDTNGHEYVDLGLPSGTLWATCNVGASKPEDYGDYFAWGETTGYKSGKANFSWSTYKYCKGSGTTLTKYCTDSNYGTVDNKTVLELSDDAAHVNWGGTWRMPTHDECNELIENCTWKWTMQNSVKGYRVTGPNGKSIFLPATGYHAGTAFYNTDSENNLLTWYWLSKVSGKDNQYAGGIGFSDVLYKIIACRRTSGSPIRPVTK